ncbi:MerR family transcriptional regulator [Gaetbulibacter sp. M235]|uniref:MerR family transcriptional regulator n=1 Tax=Gaetbulibacter sp. M235 TaxID=3126510 RepID=UPI00374EFD2A
MNNIKVEFSIKDLENLSGIKAHTIRIWEKRYNLFQPKRTETNIRYYTTESLQKILNVAFLNNNGYKISKISSLTNEEISKLVNEITSKELQVENHAINSLKLSMLTFNEHLFHKTYNELIELKTFKEIFYNTFLPLLHHIGILWQTETITPAHEHFVSTLIKQKLLLNIEKNNVVEQNKREKIFVLFLPENEIHEIGLMLINYELKSKGYQTIFLGQSIPTESLKDPLSLYDDITFISYFTIKPEREDIDNYLQVFKQTILHNNTNELWILGNMAKSLELNKLPKGISAFNTIKDLVKNL